MEDLINIDDRRVDIDDSWPGYLFPAKGEQLRDEPGPAAGCLEDFRQILRDCTVSLRSTEERFTVPDDYPEDVVEVVRNAAGQLTDGLELLRLPALRFEQGPLSNVDGYTAHEPLVMAIANWKLEDEPFIFASARQRHALLEFARFPRS